MDEVRAAIEVIKKHLDEEWIAEGCAENHAFGCASCQAVMLKKQLDGLASYVDDDDAPSPFTPDRR